MTENDNFFYAFAANPGFIEIPSIIVVRPILIYIDVMQLLAACYTLRNLVTFLHAIIHYIQEVL